MADFIKLDWPQPPEEPRCPLDTLEEMTHKALDEREDMKGKLIAQDKAMAQLKLEQQKAVDDLALVEKQALKLRKVINNRSDIIQNMVSSKEMKLSPSETPMKVNEVAKVDPSNVKREKKLEQKSEELLGSNDKDFEQNGHPYVHIPPLQVNSAIDVPLVQHLVPVYGHQCVLRSSPYFCKYFVCVCVCVRAHAHHYHSLACMQNIHVEIISTLWLVDHLHSGLVAWLMLSTGEDKLSGAFYPQIKQHKLVC
jgi:hypothetical protein